MDVETLPVVALGVEYAANPQPVHASHMPLFLAPPPDDEDRDFELDCE